MPNLAEVRHQIAAYPHFHIFWPRQFWVRKEIRTLPELLDHGETVKGLAEGSFKSNTWLAVCTDRRVLFINRGTWWGTEQAQMPLDRIQSIDHESMLFFGSITIFDGINQFTLSSVLKSSILPFVKMTEEMMYAQRHPQMRTAPAAAPTPHAPPPGDVASQIAKLADLKEKGYLTDEEFQAQKKKLLG